MLASSTWSWVAVATSGTGETVNQPRVLAEFAHQSKNRFEVFDDFRDREIVKAVPVRVEFARHRPWTGRKHRAIDF